MHIDPSLIVAGAGGAMTDARTGVIFVASTAGKVAVGETTDEVGLILQLVMLSPTFPQN